MAVETVGVADSELKAVAAPSADSPLPSSRVSLRKLLALSQYRCLQYLLIRIGRIKHIVDV